MSEVEQAARLGGVRAALMTAYEDILLPSRSSRVESA